MSIQTINIGLAPNDGSGDPLRTAFGKTNDNFSELSSNVNSLTSSLNTVSSNVNTLTTAVSSLHSNVTVLQNRAYGAFQSVSNQYCNANTATAMLFEQVDVVDGVTITANSYIGLPNAGVYNLQFSVQVKNTGVGEDNIYIWLRQNNADIAGSTGKVIVRGTQAGGSGEAIVGWNFFVRSNTAAENVQIMWFAADETHTHLAAFPAQSATATTPIIPSTASTVLTVNQVG